MSRHRVHFLSKVMTAQTLQDCLRANLCVVAGSVTFMILSLVQVGYKASIPSQELINVKLHKNRKDILSWLSLRKWKRCLSS